ncbi:hypothetical protein SO802_018096 [Lithocarpus litseifolius]|uniref:GH18 domain-containing protein n=1 Tax=Lithocarpus litseifolius TaxID=425828 RepID=A0AAW2CLW2_9ROSI
MDLAKLFITLLIIEALFISQIQVQAAPTNSNLFREYIGAQFKNVKFTDVPINPNVEFHFILSFAIDYDTSGNPSPTNGKFNIFWDSDNLSPSQVSSIKNAHPNVKVALSLGGDTVRDVPASFSPSSVDSWVSNAVSSLTRIIKQYHLDGIDVDYEHFKADPDTFAECIGKLITTLKRNKFYAYDKGTTVPQFLDYFKTQSSNYNGGKVLVSFGTDASGGLKPDKGFFKACEKLKSQQQLHGIFIWSADDSKENGFRYEKEAQGLLAGRH